MRLMLADAARPALRALIVVAVMTASSVSGIEEPAPLPLAAAIARVERVAPQLRAAADRVDAARGALHQAGRFPNPLFEARAENVRVDSNVFTAGNPPLDFFALLSQPVELGGKRSTRTAVAAADLQASGAELELAERQVKLDTMRLYLAAVRARELAAYFAENRTELDPLLEVVRRRVVQGYTAAADLAKLQAEAARVDSQLAQARFDLERSTLALGVNMGDDTPVAPARLVEPPLIDLPPESADVLAARIVEAQPLLRATRARLERAHETVRLQKARRIPDPLVTGGYKRVDDRDTIVMGVVVPIPVLDTNAGNIERALAEERAAAADIEALRRQLAAEAMALIAGARGLTERARRIDADLVEPAHVARQAARSTFRELGSNVLALVDAERVHTEAHRDALDVTLEAIARAFEVQVDLPAELAP
ncbi:TolC family protein [Candidatus Binatia bacterium]|nr:TolC family protein [Candidatus Binatia bacterium]